jgi:hypothetical protein
VNVGSVGRLTDQNAGPGDTDPVAQKGIAMSKSSTSIRLRRCTTAVAGLLASIVAICVAAPAAFATMLPAPGDSGAAPVVHSSGTPTWEIALIAIGVTVAFGLVTLAAVAVVRGHSTARAQRALS